MHQMGKVLQYVKEIDFLNILCYNYNNFWQVKPGLRGVLILRVISGSARKRRLKAPPGWGVRPTADRVKEALFNILAERIPGCVFLDLYAGTGGIGIEALSRGAELVLFVEKDARVMKVLREIGRASCRERV